MLAAARQGDAAARAGLVYEVLQTYAGVRATRELATAARRALAAARAYAGTAASLYRQGIVIKSDVLLAKAHEESARAALSAAEAEVLNQLDAFRLLIGRPGSDLVPGPAVKMPAPIATLRALEDQALDRLARESRFVPDLVVVDYGDLMKVDASNYRLSVGDAFLQLRRIAVDRDLAVVTASQSNRESTRATLVTESDVAEDFSKIATADWSLTYSQTAAERVLGLARIFVAAGRDAQDKQTAVIAQSYARGQFCLDAARLPDKWTTMLADAGGGVDGAE